MSFFLFIIFLVFVFGIVFLFSVIGVIRSIIKAVFGFGKRKKTSSNEQNNVDRDIKNKSKIFDKTEGEYVDYEEIKE